MKPMNSIHFRGDSAQRIAARLGGRKVGAGWMARCPAHDDRLPSLSISINEEGKLLVYCHAGCGQGEVLRAFRSLGLAMGLNAALSHSEPNPPVQTAKCRTEAALRIWSAAQSATHTLVEPYMASRGICVPLPPTIRFHPDLKHPSGGRWPAMIALVTRGTDNKPLGIHRTFLARDGRGKAPVQPQRMVLGPCAGGCVRLGPIQPALMIGEGIETCLAAMQMMGFPAWAALSTSGLRSLELPIEVQEATILADGDGPGMRAAHSARLRWKSDGHGIRIAYAPNGLDFNDVLLRKGDWS